MNTDRKSTVTKSWSAARNRVQYRIKVEGHSNGLMFSESELAALAENIRIAQGGNNNDDHRTT